MNKNDINKQNHSADAKSVVNIDNLNESSSPDDDIPGSSLDETPKLSPEELEKIQNHVPVDIDDPLTANPVIQRGYTNVLNGAQNGTASIPGAASGAGGFNPPPDIPEPAVTRPTFTIPPPIDEPGASMGQQTQGGNNYTPPKPPPPPKYNAAAGDMSNAAKRKAAKETAEVILRGYQQILPKPFIAISSYKINKMRDLHKKNQINLNIIVKQDGTTIEGYMKGFNNQVKQAIYIDDEMIEELREPLVEVLMERDIVMTPMQKLLAGVGMHIVKLGSATFQLVMQRQQEMKDFMNMHAENIRNNVYQKQASAQPQPQPQAEPKKQEQQPNQQPQKNDNKQNVADNYYSESTSTEAPKYQTTQQTQSQQNVNSNSVEFETSPIHDEYMDNGMGNVQDVVPEQTITHPIKTEIDMDDVLEHGMGGIEVQDMIPEEDDDIPM